MSKGGFLRASLGAATLLASLATSACTSILGDFSSGGGSTNINDSSTKSDGVASGDGSASDDSGGGLPLGTACTATTVCGGGHSCTDGVCCESACDGVCEACNLTGTVGQGAPIPMNTDPQMECVAVSLPEGGTGDAATEEEGGAIGADAGDATVVADGAVDATLGGGSSASEAGSDASSEGGADAAQGVAYPDGGVVITQNVCAGTCNGQRACAFPDTTTGCGTQFCATSSSIARFACNSQGGCSLYSSPCGAYACEGEEGDAGGPNVEGACVTSCSQTTDCSSSSYCNGQSCEPKLGLAIQCVIGSECQSGFCVDSVCCDSACDSIPGATCTKTGLEGTCQCSLDCGDGGSCVLYYQDADGDGYGNEDGTVSNGLAVVGCSNAPPAGAWVLDNTDCDDQDANAHPGQTAWFTTQRAGIGGYDYNCDGTNEQEYAEYPGQGCYFCNGTAPSCSYGGECAAEGDQAYLSCASQLVCFFELSTRAQQQSVSLEIINPIGPIRDCVNECEGATQGFNSAVACGASGQYVTCGTCSAADSYTVTGTSTNTSLLQGCH